MKKTLISMLAVCSIACGVVGATQFVETKAEDYSSALSMVKGAYVRVDTSSAFHNGIKFEATMDKGVYDTLESDKVDYGMVIVPLDYGEITKDNLFGAERKYYIEGVTEAADGLQKIGGGYVSELQEYGKDSTKMVLEGSIVNIAPSQLTREFVGVPFIHIDNEYYVGAYGGEEYARSMVYVAQRGIQAGTLTDAQETYLKDNYLTGDVASKQYAYTVEHIKLDPEGNVLATETVDGEKTTLGATVTASENTYDNYTYDAEKSTVSDIVYANNRTTLKLYYVQNHVNVTVSDGACTITPDDEKYAGKKYALIEDGMYHFTVTPPANFNKHTQQIYGFVNDALWIANGAEGKYMVDLSSYANGSTIKLGASVGEFAPTIGAGKGNYMNLVSVTKSTESDGSALYTYTNKTPGLDTGTNSNWGESGLFFDEVYNFRQDANAQQNKFFNKGYKYIRFDVKFADNTTGYNIRVKDTTYQMEFGSAYDKKSGIARVVNPANVAVTTIAKDVWYTVYIQPTKGQLWTLWTDGGSETAPSITYIKNVQYLEENPTYDVNLVMRLNGQLPERDASLEYKVDGNFAGAYKYTNGTLGTTGGVWGEAGVFFNEIYNANTGAGAGQTFFNNGYKYIKLDFYAENSVYSISIQNAWTVGNNYVHLKAGDILSSSSAFAIYDKNGNKVNQWTAGDWYTLLIKPNSGETMRIQTNAETKESAAPVMYLRNFSYEKTNPFFRPTMVVNSNLASLEMEAAGEFVGAYKYTNTSLGTAGNQYGDAGIYFDEIFPISGGHNTAFHDGGYQYVTIEFYATESVHSISLCENWMTAGAERVYTITAGQTLVSNDIFAIYNANGEKVDKWTVGEWYTLVIKPHTDTAGGWTYPLRIQTNAETSTSAAPVMYLKNVAYTATNPFAN